MVRGSDLALFHIGIRAFRTAHFLDERIAREIDRSQTLPLNIEKDRRIADDRTNREQSNKHCRGTHCYRNRITDLNRIATTNPRIAFLPVFISVLQHFIAHLHRVFHLTIRAFLLLTSI